MVGQRVDDDGGVLAGLDDLVEVADRPGAHGARERPVHPHRLVAGQQVAADEVGGGQVLVAGDRDEGRLGAAVPAVAEAPRHVLDEAGLAAAGRPLEQHGQAGRVRRLNTSTSSPTGRYHGASPVVLGSMAAIIAAIGAGAPLGSSHTAARRPRSAAPTAAPARTWARLDRLHRAAHDAGRGDHRPSAAASRPAERRDRAGRWRRGGRGGEET